MRTSFGENHGGGARFVAITALSASAAAVGGGVNINAAAPPGAGSSGLSSSCMMSTGSSVVAFDRTSRSNSANMGVEGGGGGGQTFSVQQVIPIVEDTLPLSSPKDASYRNEDLSRVSLLLTSTTPGKGLITVQAAADTLLHSCLVNPVVLVPSDCSCSTNHDDGRGWYKGRAGTSAYWCPQMLSRDSHNERLSYGVDADWWSLGCLTFALMTGRSPFATGMGTNFDNSQTLEGSAKIHWPKGLFSRESRDFVSRLCTIDPTKRLGSGPEGWKQVMSHQWFRGVDFALLEARVLPPPTMPSYRISTNWSVIPDKIDNQHKGIVAEEAAAVEASAKASADNAVLSAEDEAIFRACTFTSPMLFKRAWLQCCASKTLDELLALSMEFH
jgi:serine/threonine protein kinase